MTGMPRKILAVACAILCVYLYSVMAKPESDKASPKGEHGYLIFDVEPKDAKAFILQDKKEVERFVGGAKRRALPPGSYILRLEAQDRETVELPFKITLHNETKLSSILLKFPDGYVRSVFENKYGWYWQIIVNDKVYFPDWYGHIFCLDFNSGKTLWKKKFFEAKYYYTHIASDGKNIFAVSTEGNFLCVEPEKGRVIWEYKIGRRLDVLGGIISITPSPGNVFLHVNGELICVDSATGRKKWRSLDAGISSAYSDGYVYVGNKTINTLNNLVCREIRQIDVRTGMIKNTFKLPESKKAKEQDRWGEYYYGYGYGYSAVIPVVHGKQLYVTHMDDRSHLYCFDTVTGKLKWTFSPRMEISPGITVSDEGNLYLIAGNKWVDDSQHGALYCLNAETGEKNWESDFKLPFRYRGTPVLGGENIYFMSDHYLFCVSAKTGEHKWKKDIDHQWYRDTYHFYLITICRDQLLLVNPWFIKGPNASVGRLMCIQIDETGFGDWLTWHGNPANTNTKVPPGGLAPVKKKK